MARRRSSVLLLGALVALLGLPASALAAAPNNTTALPPAGGWVQSGYVVAVTGLDPDGDPITQVEWTIDGGAPQTGPNGSEVTITGGPTVQLVTRVQDSNGEWSDPRPADVYNIDDAPPLDLTSSDAVWRPGAYDVPLLASPSGSAPIAKFQYKLNDELVPVDTVGLGPWTAPVVPDGQHQLYTRAFDTAGNFSAWKAHDVYIDSQAPFDDTQVISGWYTTSPVTIDVEGSDVTSGIQKVRWRKASVGAFTEVLGTSTPVTFSTDGQHTLATEVVDMANHATATKTQTVKIDTVDPVNTTPAAPVGAVDNPYQVTVNGTDVGGSGMARVEYKVDGGAVQSVNAGTQIEVAGHGPRTLETRVVDVAGRTSAWRPETITLDAKTNDVVDPTDTTTTAAAGWRPVPIPVTVAATDDGSGVIELQWRLDGQPIKTWPGENPSFTISGEGEHLLETMAIDDAGNATDWRAQTFKVDLTVPADTTDIVDGAWRTTRTFTLTGTDAYSGLRWIDYSVDGALAQHGNPNQVITLPSDGTFTVTTRAIDNVGHASQLRTTTVKVDTVDPVNTTPVPDPDWVVGPVELPLTGTDGGSGVEKIEWRVDGGDVHDEGPAVIEEDGEHVLETRVVDRAGRTSGWRSDPVKVDSTVPVNTTPAVPSAWRNTPYSTVITGDDGDGSGLDVIERTVDGGPVSNDPNVTVGGDGVHTLRSRVLDLLGQASDWREDVIRIDTVAPAAGLSCSAGADAWSAAPVACTVSADGGPSGLGSLTLAGADGGTAAVASGATATVSADGQHVLRLDAVDGAGNGAAAEAVVHVDRTAPAASLSCTAAAGKYTCTAAASDATSGLAALGYSIDGGSIATIAPGASFTVAKGKVQLRATDAAGNVSLTAPLTLAAIPEGATARVASVPVYLKGRKTTASMVGALNAVRSASGTVSLDLRPLAVGRGRYRVVIALKSGKRSREFKRTYKVGRSGALPRMSTSLSRAVDKTTVKLTVRKRVGRKWRRHASTKLVLPK
jgi:hypothetical protein